MRDVQSVVDASPTIQADLESTNPEMVKLASGNIQLVELYAYRWPACKSMAPIVNGFALSLQRGVTRAVGVLDTLCVYVVFFAQPLRGGLRMNRKQDNKRRLKTVEGHIRGVQRMVEEDSYCINTIRQIHAIQSALNKISINILDNHLNSCLISAVRGNDLQEQDRVLKEIIDVFEAATKV